MEKNMQKFFLASVAILSLSACDDGVQVEMVSKDYGLGNYSFPAGFATRMDPPWGFANSMSHEDRLASINAWYDQERASAIRQMQERLAELERKRRATIEYESKS
jgi:hypothetical protein